MNKNLKIARIRAELTQKELAEKTGIRLPTISALCTGAAKHIPVNVLDKLCTTLDCQPGDLVEYLKDETEE